MIFATLCRVFVCDGGSPSWQGLSGEKEGQYGLERDRKLPLRRPGQRNKDSISANICADSMTGTVLSSNFLLTPLSGAGPYATVPILPYAVAQVPESSSGTIAHYLAQPG